MTAAMLPKLSDAFTRKDLENASIQMKKILNLWFELMKTMKSVNYQHDEACFKFKENTDELKKEIYSLVTNPPRSRM